MLWVEGAGASVSNHRYVLRREWIGSGGTVTRTRQSGDDLKRAVELMDGLKPTNKSLNWKPIKKVCIEAAESLGHKLEAFKNFKNTGWLKMASCKKCYGCCWIAHTPSRGFGAGGRLLIYRCGTPEAEGLLPTTSDGALKFGRKP